MMTIGALDDVEGKPDVVRELQLRIRPLREQWDARGPGFLRSLSRRLPWLTLPNTVTVAVVHPVRGGGGWIVSDTICFEAVLANPQPQLPEVVRLGWYVAQLAAQQALRKLRDSRPDRWVDMENLLAAALIPPVLSAAEHVELSSVDTEVIQTALGAWHLSSQPTTPSAQQLYQWWQQHGSMDTPDARMWWQSVADSFHHDSLPVT